MPSLKMMSNDDIDYDDSAFGKRCICWSAFNGDISVAHTRDAEPQFFNPPGGRLLISHISRCGIFPAATWVMGSDFAHIAVGQLTLHVCMPLQNLINPVLS